MQVNFTKVHGGQTTALLPRPAPEFAGQDALNDPDAMIRQCINHQEMLQQAHQQDALRQAAGLAPLERPWSNPWATPVQASNPDYELLVSLVMGDHGVLNMPTDWPHIAQPDAARESLDPAAAQEDGVTMRRLAQQHIDPAALDFSPGTARQAEDASLICAPEMSGQVSRHMVLADLLTDQEASLPQSSHHHLALHSSSHADTLSWQDNLQQYYQSLV